MMKPKVKAVEVLVVTLADIAIYTVQTLALAIASAMATPEPQHAKEATHAR